MGLLEIKCPYKLKDSDLKNVTSGDFFIVRDGRLCLKKTHSYFFQVQTQMFVCGALYTDFFIYTPQWNHTERIYYDHSFAREAIVKAIDGFRAYVIPEHFEQRAPRHLPVIEL